MMPLYTMKCPDCGNTESIFRKIDQRNDPLMCYALRDLHDDEEWDGGAEPECHTRMERIIEAPMVAPDIGPYQAVAIDVATGKPPVINSRSAHRDFLKRNGYTEVGNERVGR
jgi:hypothetical protein